MERDAHPSTLGGVAEGRGRGRGRGYATPRYRGRVTSNGQGRSVDRRNVDSRIAAGTGVPPFNEHMSGKGSSNSDGARQIASRGARKTSNSIRRTSWQSLGNDFSKHSPSSSNGPGSSHRDHTYMQSRNSTKTMDESLRHNSLSSPEGSLDIQICSLEIVDEKSSRKNMVEGNQLVSPDSFIGKTPHPNGKTGHDDPVEGVQMASQSGPRGSTECLINADRFDICPPTVGSTFVLKPSLLEKNREKKKEMKQAMEGQKEMVLRDGMVLLKNYISIAEQVKIIKECRRLGLGPGGFYQPGYRDGAKLHLKMMCLGQNWDPETSKYGELRPTDGARPPAVPKEFLHLVKRSIEDSLVLVAKKCGAQMVEKSFPQMEPDICLVNFYSASGRLGLHQDRDESKESLQKGLPVVSVSIGDSAEFLFGDGSNVDKAEKVVLESGDVLIFGGKSRHVYHGVSSILPNTAPKSLLKETNVRPGRLNLTFRKY